MKRPLPGISRRMSHEQAKRNLGILQRVVAVLVDRLGGDVVVTAPEMDEAAARGMEMKTAGEAMAFRVKRPLIVAP
jgi:uncharacterized membrane protein YqjE